MDRYIIETFKNAPNIPFICLHNRCNNSINDDAIIQARIHISGTIDGATTSIVIIETINGAITSVCYVCTACASSGNLLTLNL